MEYKRKRLIRAALQKAETKRKQTVRQAESAADTEQQTPEKYAQSVCQLHTPPSPLKQNMPPWRRAPTDEK